MNGQNEKRIKKASGRPTAALLGLQEYFASSGHSSLVTISWIVRMSGLWVREDLSHKKKNIQAHSNCAKMAYRSDKTRVDGFGDHSTK